MYLDAQSSIQDLETALLDVRMVEKRRKIADAQLELAREGRLGIDYDKKSSTSMAVVGDEPSF